MILLKVIQFRKNNAVLNGYAAIYFIVFSSSRKIMLQHIFSHVAKLAVHKNLTKTRPERSALKFYVVLIFRINRRI